MIHATAEFSWRDAARRQLGKVGVVACLLLAGCAALPAQEMSNARQAIEAASRAGGEQKAATQMQEARSALSRAETALRERHYKQARQLAQEARTKAIEAQQASGAPGTR